MSSTSRLRVLIHGINFAPEFIGVGKYTTELAVHAAQEGLNVEVITAPPHYPGWQVREPYNGFRYTREVIQGIDVQRCPILTRKGGNGLWRMLAPFSFAVFAAPVVGWRILRSRPDIVMCVEPTLFSAPVALLAAKMTGARTLLHVQDLEVDAAFGVGHLRGGWLRSIAHCYEKWVLKSFDRVVTISESMRNALVLKGVDREKTVLIRNWVQLDSIYRQPMRPNAFRDELGLADNDHVVLYAGHLGKKQALHHVIEAASALALDDRLKFVIVGEGPEKAALEAQAAGLRNVKFLPLQPIHRLNDLLALANAHVLPQSAEAADLVLPSKLGGMLASGRPIVAMADSGTELALILERAALVVPAGDVSALVHALRETLTRDLTTEVNVGLLIAQKLSAGRALGDFVDVFNGLARGAQQQSCGDCPEQKSGMREAAE
jgi:colanic acid biosynthesis glycosyl transferase WcaI